jgi:hypothetical protein
MAQLCCAPAATSLKLGSGTAGTVVCVVAGGCKVVVIGANATSGFGDARIAACGKKTAASTARADNATMSATRRIMKATVPK